MNNPFSGLEELTIRNMGVIESAHVEFSQGLNILTGETGAGKTMVLTALSLLLGGKADSDRIRTGADRAVLSGTFSLSDEAIEKLQENLDEVGAEMDGNSLVISRTITSDGKSRLNLGGVGTTASKVGEISEHLIEIHAQSSVSRLTRPTYIRDVVDRFAGNNVLLDQYISLYDSYKELHERINQLIKDQKNRALEIEEISTFLKAFHAVNPESQELNAVEVEIAKLDSVDELQQAASSALNLVNSEEISVASVLAQGKRALEHAAGKDAHLDSLTEKLSDLLFGVQELTGDISRYLADLDSDPAKLEYLQQRKSAINALIKKYGEGADREIAFERLIERAKSSAARVADLEGGEDRVSELKIELEEIWKSLIGAASKLSQARKQAAADIEFKISDELKKLAMPHSSVVIEVRSVEPTNIQSLNSYGADELQILFTSHEGAKPGPISKVASGGELSRAILAIEVVLASAYPVSTYIFDEVDAGVGGKAAVEVGRRLKDLSRSAQVIVVTHLAQVAVWGDRHLVVRKNESGQVSVSDVAVVSGNERAIEIARMLSGQEESATAQEHALELLNMVGDS